MMDRKELSTPRLILLTVLLPVAMLVTNPGLAQAPGGQNTSGFLALSGEEAANFDLPPDMQLVQSSYNVQNGLTYERYQQYFGVAQVLGAQVTLYIDDSGTIATVIGAHYPDIAPANFARLSGANARAVVDRDIGAGGNRNVDLLINPETGRYFHRIETQRPYSRWFHWIDADNGRVLNKYDAIETDDVGVKDDTKDIGGLTTRHSTGRPQNRGYWLQSSGNRQLTYDDGNNGGVANIMIDSDNDWHDELGPNSPGQPAGVDAHFYANVVDDYFQNIHGRNSFNNGGASMVSIVHIPNSNSNNAFWNGQQVVYGDGDGTEFREFSGALDVVGHEWTHAVTDYSSNLIYQNESGALNESFSDQMGNSIEFFADGKGLDPTVSPDWLIAEDISLFPDTAPGFRNMADPEEDGSTDGYFPARFPDHYTEWFSDPVNKDGGGVHINSGIANHAYYLLVNGGLNASCASPGNHNSLHCDGVGIGDGTPVIGIGLAIAEKIFYQAFTALSSGATMCAARAAAEAVANSLFPAHSPSVADAWVAVGLTDTVCGPGPSDTTPPADPTGLTASASDGSVSLDWGDNDESDLAGYNVYRSTTPGEAYTKINASLVTSSGYDDSELTNGSTYYYVVRAVDTSDNESGNSDEVSATPLSSGLATTMHVQSIVLATVDMGQGFKQAKAMVTILDDQGNPVSGASVTGTFTGDIAEQTVPADTIDGLAVLTTTGDPAHGRLKFTFCVDNVVDNNVVDTLTYNNNGETCDSN